MKLLKYVMLSAIALSCFSCSDDDDSTLRNDLIKKTVGDIPFITEFTFGEYGYEDDGNNTCGGLMLSFTAFGK